MEEQDRILERQRELTEYLDGQLSRRQALDLERRLAEDPALREELRRYAALEGQLSALGAAEPAGVDYDAQRQDILYALERKALLERRPPVRIIRFWPGVFAAAAAAAVFLVGRVLTPPGFPPAPRPFVAALVLPIGPPVRGTAVVRAECVPVSWDNLILAPGEAPEEVPATPPGTVVVSIGPEEESPAADMDFLYPF